MFRHDVRQETQRHRPGAGGSESNPTPSQTQKTHPNPQPEWDPAAATGGNPLEVNVNAPYALQEFHYIYLMLCAFVVWLIIPGVGLLYGGLARRKSSLALLFQSLLVTAVSTFTWMFWVRSSSLTSLPLSDLPTRAILSPSHAPQTFSSAT